VRPVARPVVWLVYAASLVLAVCVIALTPFALSWIAPDGRRWNELSEISQTYSIVSVPLSAAAVLGVVVSLSYQARQVRLQSEGNDRSTHREMILMALHDPDLALCLEPPPVPMTAQRRRQHMYLNLFFSYWHSQYIVGHMGREEVRAIVSEFFRGELPREFWRLHAPGWRAVEGAAGGENIEFVRLIDRLYDEATAEGPGIPVSDYYIPEGQDD